ncbi:Cupin domain-containing protein [Desulfobotulus alkaliphilus]|uniref:Cupin domain-containing protein n=1 Tax=Desulfobotulus alkaliphilus TaxID=622671 RepID=A0A562RTB0_9BACT|nr:cupin domain-containing protein [Desulfobotulus alkaliphilus]TWI72321.1 Cupin domain-containing protein [Desulfobotulus alkaliphilus]
MKEQILTQREGRPFYTEERCWIEELSNSSADPGLSIARVRVEAGVSTQLHRLKNTTERYLILSGRGRIEVGALPPQEVFSGDVVLIPPDCPQRITCLGKEDLIFLVFCTPRFLPEAYENLEDGNGTIAPNL